MVIRVGFRISFLPILDAGGGWVEDDESGREVLLVLIMGLWLIMAAMVLKKNKS